MPEELTQELIEEWIDEDQFDLINNLNDSSEFNIELRRAGYVFHVLKYSSQDHVLIMTRLPIPADIMANLLDLRTERNDLQVHLEHVLTSSKGIYIFVDEDNNETSFENMDGIMLQRFMYPDGASQQLLMESLFELASSVNFVGTAISTTADNIDSRR